jgi:hypothetical protein
MHEEGKKKTPCFLKTKTNTVFSNETKFKSRQKQFIEKNHMRRQRSENSISFSQFFENNENSNNSNQPVHYSASFSSSPDPQQQVQNQLLVVDEEDEEFEEFYEWVENEDDGQEISPNSKLGCCLVEIVDDDDDDEIEVDVEEKIEFDRNKLQKKSKSSSNKKSVSSSSAFSSARSSVTILANEQEEEEMKKEETLVEQNQARNKSSSSSSSSSSPTSLSSSSSSSIHSSPKPSSAANLPSSSLIEKALGIWKNAQNSFLSASNPQEDNNSHYFYLNNNNNNSTKNSFCYSLIRDRFVEQESVILLSGIRTISRFLNQNENGVSKSDDKIDKEQVKTAFLNIIRFVVKDLRLFTVLLPCFSSSSSLSNQQLFNEADFCLHVVLGKVRSNNDKDFINSSSFSFCQQVCFNAPSVVIESMTKFLSENEKKSEFLLVKMLDLVLSKLDKFASSVWNFKEKHSLHEQTQSTYTNNNNNFMKSLFAQKLAILMNPDRLAICSLVKLFSLLVRKIILPSSGGNSHCKFLKNWILNNSPIFQNRKNEEKATNNSIMTNPNFNMFRKNERNNNNIPLPSTKINEQEAILSRNMKRFRLFASRVDQTMSSEMIRCWSALSRI